MKRLNLGRGLSLVDLVRGPRGRKLGRRGRSANRGRQLWFEECESRNLLAATISGFKFATAAASGFTPGADLPMAGVTINLRQGSDSNPPVATTTTAADGSFAFNNVADGHYFIDETVPTGFTQSAGPAFYTIDVIGGLVYSTPANDPTTTLNVDDFSAPDPAATYFINAIDPNPLFRQDSSAAGQLPILGDQRDLLVDVLGPANPISANGFVGTVSLNNGVFNLGSATNGPGTEVTMQYDGTDVDSAALNNAMGLNANLSANGGAGIRFDFDFLQVGTGTTMDMEINATSSGGSATFSGLIQQNTGGFSVFVPFSSLTTSGAFDLAHVTSLQVSFNAAGVQDVDYEITQIAIAGFNFGNFAVSKRLFLTPAGPSTVTSSFGGATFSFNSGTGRMDVDGTSGNDTISIVPNIKGIAVVTVNGHVLSNTIPLVSIQQIGIAAGDGDDTITLTNIVKPVLFDGGAGTDRLIVNGAVATNNSFVVSGTQLFYNGAQYNMGNVEGLTLNGGSKTDTLLVQTAPAFPTTFNGGGGTDAVVGPNTANIWDITANGGGTLNGSLSFSAVENLFGGSSSDGFKFGSGHKIAGIVDGGGGNDTLGYAGYNQPVTVNLQTKKAPLIGGFANIEDFDGGSASDTFIGANQANSWVIEDVNSGDVNGIGFSNFENLTGGTSTDTFQFVGSGSMSGKINGAAGTDKLDYSAPGPIATVNLQTSTATSTGGFLNIEGVIGSSTTTLIGANKNSTWNITGASTGSVGGFSFAGVGNLTGGMMNDTFVFANGSTVAGKIDGGAGTDTLNYNAFTTTITVDLTAGTATNLGGGFTNIENVVGSNVVFV